jgi:hypothetical protein
MVSDGGPQSKMVQLYRPRGLSEDARVSVSGIDISKNKKEVLVSYENDQIYSFPICPGGGAAGPTVDELTALSNEMEEEETVQHELCAYGGHLNRYTFLKVSSPYMYACQVGLGVRLILLTFACCHSVERQICGPER